MKKVVVKSKTTNGKSNTKPSGKLVVHPEGQSKTFKIKVRIKK